MVLLMHSYMPWKNEPPQSQSEAKFPPDLAWVQVSDSCWLPESAATTHTSQNSVNLFSNTCIRISCLAACFICSCNSTCPAVWHTTGLRPTVEMRSEQRSEGWRHIPSLYSCHADLSPRDLPEPQKIQHWAQISPVKSYFWAEMFIVGGVILSQYLFIVNIVIITSQ